MTKVTSYEISKKLAEAGFNIPSDFLINQNGRILHNATKQFIGKIPSFSKPSKEGCEYLGNNYASYDLETILDALPEELINKMALYKEYERATFFMKKEVIGYEFDNDEGASPIISRSKNESLADCAALLWLALKEKGLLNKSSLGDCKDVD
jgi:hypothetical protein